LQESQQLARCNNLKVSGTRLALGEVPSGALKSELNERESVMKSILNRVAVVLVVAALTSVVALAKVQTHRVTFENDLKVNNTLVKKGTYEVSFDDQTGQFSILKNKKVVAQTTARLEPRAKKASDFQMRSTGSGDEAQLIGVTFGGSDKDVVISNSGGSASGSN
jgi:hypothetical protein